jgi:carboxymethylenebutenolidase
MDLEKLWQRHCQLEFDEHNVEETMKTMVDEPYVNHVPTLTGGTGYDALRRFYARHFVSVLPADTKLIPISRTIGTNRLVDEMVFCFTHDRAVDFLVPGVPATGKYVEVPMVAIVTFDGDKIASEHIYWDQATVLVQLGLLEAKGLPVSGAEQARKLMDRATPCYQFDDDKQWN